MYCYMLVNTLTLTYGTLLYYITSYMNIKDFIYFSTYCFLKFHEFVHFEAQ